MNDIIRAKDGSRIEAFKAGMEEAINRIMPDLKSVEVLPGRFNLDDLQDRSFRAPAAFPTVLKSNFKMSAGLQLTLVAKCACFFVAQGREDERNKNVWAMAEAFASILPGNRFGMFKIGSPTDIEVDPLISAKIKNKGVSVVAITWSQELHALGEGLFDDNKVVLSQFYVNGELADEVVDD